MDKQTLIAAIAADAGLPLDAAQRALDAVLARLTSAFGSINTVDAAATPSHSIDARSTDARSTEARFTDDYLAHLLARASHLISAEFHAMLARRRIPGMHWRVLGSIIDGPLPVAELAKAILAKQPTVSKLIDRMAEEGLVERTPYPDSRRRTLVAITPQGRQLAEQLVALAREHERETLRPLAPATATELIRALQALIDIHQK